MIYLIFSIVLIAITHSAVSCPANQPNPYIITGTRKLIASKVAQNQQTTNSDSGRVYYTFRVQPAVLQTNPFTQMGVALSVCQYSFYYPHYNDWLSFYVNTSNVASTDFSIQLIHRPSNLNFIIDLSVMYLAVDLSKFPEIIHFSRERLDPAQEKDGKREFSYNKPHNPIFSWDPLKYWISITGYSRQTFDKQSLKVEIVDLQEAQFIVQIHRSNSYYIEVYFIIISENLMNIECRYHFTATIQKNNAQEIHLNEITPPTDSYILGFNHLGAITQSTHQQFEFLPKQNIIRLQQITLEITITYLHLSLIFCPNNQYYNLANNSCIQQCPDNTTMKNGYCNYIPQCANYFSYENCSRCESTKYFLQNLTSCKKCSDHYPNCATCNNIQCFICNTTRYFREDPDQQKCICVNNSSKNQQQDECVCVVGYYGYNEKCQRCDQQCLTCQKHSFYCTSCNNSKLRVIDTDHQCNCIQQFKQSHQPGYCEFERTLNITLNASSIIKNPYENTLTLQINIDPHLEIFNLVNFSSILNLGLYQSAISYSYSNGILSVQIHYQQSLHNITTNFTIELQQGDEVLQYGFANINNQRQEYTIVPSNNLVANYYPDSYYFMAKNLKYAIYSLVGLSFLVFAIGSYSSKLIVLEMMTVIQIAYIGSFTTSLSQPLITPLSLLRYSHGFSDISTTAAGNIPQQIQNKGYSSDMIGNKNIVTLFQIIPFIIALGYFIITKIKKYGNEWMISKYKLLIGEWTMFAVLFSLNNFGASATLFVMFFDASSPNLAMNLISIIFEIGVVVFVFVMYGITDYNYCGEFKYSFKWNDLALNYYYSQMALKLVSGCLLAGMSRFYYSSMVVSVLFLMVAIFTVVARPYSDNLQTVRSTANLLLGSLILGGYTLMEIQGPKLNNFNEYIPVFIVGLLYLITFMGTGFLIRSFKMNFDKLQQNDILQSKAIQNQEQKHVDLLKKQIQQLTVNDKSADIFSKKLHRKTKKPKKNRKDSLQTKMEKNYQQMEIQRELINEENLNYGEDDNGECLNKLKGELTLEKVMELDRMLRDGEFL